MQKFTEDQLKILNDAYDAVMITKNATPEQELLWRFNNAMNCINAWQKLYDSDPVVYADRKDRIREVIEGNV
jgi:hypothetical protein